MQKNESQEVLKIKEKLQEQKKALREEISHAINVICKFGVIEDMDNVCTYDTFKVRVEHQLAKKRKEIIDSKINDEYGTVFMGDMDNLGRVNRVHNESIVDSTICNVIKDIRKALDNNDIGRYDIGKLGDEIYIYVPDKINKDANEIVNQLNRIEETVQDNVGVETGPCNDHIGISFGSSKDFSHGLEDTIEQAENEMAKNKFQKKITKIREAIENKNGKEFVINCFLEEIDSKLRIDKKKLTPEQLELYKKNKKDCIEKIIQEYIEQQSLETAKREKEAELESFIKKDLEREKEKVKKQFPDLKLNDRDVEVLCIAKKLQQSPIDKTQNINKFYSLGYKVLEKASREDTIKELENTKMMSIDIGKIKYINDNYGHGICDKLVYSLVERIINALDESNIKLKTDVITDRISTYHMLFDGNVENKKIETFKQKLEDIEKSQILTINASEPRKIIENEKEINKYEKYIFGDDQQLIKDAFDTTKQKNLLDAKQKSMDKKIKNQREIYEVTKTTMGRMLSTYEYAKGKDTTVDIKKDFEIDK